MRSRHWVIIALSGLAGFAAVALCLAYAMSFRGANPGIAAAAIGGPFTLTDDTVRR